MKKMKICYSGRKDSISTASLPDIVFMLLFFFMVTAVMREIDVKVRLNLPDATEVKKLENKSLIRYIYIGEPLNSRENGNLPLIQIDDAYRELNRVGESIENWRSVMNESDLPKMTISLKVDKDTEMSIVTDVKQELRIVNALKISYAAVSHELQTH